MKLSYQWLSALCDIPVTPDELVEVLTFLGAEVEDVKRYRATLEHVVIGHVVECKKMEGSDHLSVTQTDVGGKLEQIVCGAPNVRAGQKVAVMLPGGTTAEGIHIKKAKLRGHESHGMICSERELGLLDEHEGIIVGDDAWEVGTAASGYLQLDDTIFDIEITPNRPDFLSHIGVARDLAAKFKTDWKWPDYLLKESNRPAADAIKVSIDYPNGCPRYAARVVQKLKIAPSPYKTRLRMARCGVRPISNIVDVTNYLMLEFGHPLHAFDARFIGGNEIKVRCARDKEKFTTLDGREHELRGSDVLIADATHGIALAGVMGGQHSEIRGDTSDVVIECAYFNPVHIRRTSKYHGIGTDSSRRFERGCDPNIIPRVVDAAAALMHEVGGGEVLSGIVDVYPQKIGRNVIAFRPQRTSHVVGVEIDHGEMRDILHRLDCEIDGKGDLWKVKAPTHRPDLTAEIDLIEEVIRVHGYDEIPTGSSSRVPLVGHDHPLYTIRRRVREVMVGLGFNETLSVSMATPEPRREPPNMPPGVTIANPVTDDMQRLHGSLLPSLVKSAAANWKRGDKNLRLFETARVFAEGAPDDPRTWERLSLAGLMTGGSQPENWSRPTNSLDYYDLKGILSSFATQLRLDNLQIFCYDTESNEVLGGEVKSGESTLGQWGIWTSEQMGRCDIDAPVAWFDLDLSRVAGLKQAAMRFEPLPRFPISWRDLAVVLDESIPAADIIQVARSGAGQFISSLEPFDIFRSDKLGVGKKSVALRFEFSHPDRSLKDDEVDAWMKSAFEALRKSFDAVLR